MAYNPELPAGTYRAKAKDAGTYDSKNGALMLGVVWEITEGDFAGCTITSRDCLVNSAGQLMDKKIDLTREWAKGWDGMNLEWFKANYPQFDVEIVVERKQNTYNGKKEIRPEVAWINPPDGGGHGIPKGDTKSLSARFGAKLRAYAASKPRPASQQPKPQRTPQNAGNPPSGESAESAEPPTPPDEPDTPQKTAKQLMEEAYQIHCKKTESLSKEERTRQWFAVVARVTDRKDYANLPPETWEAVIEELNGDLPF